MTRMASLPSLAVLSLTLVASRSPVTHPAALLCSALLCSALLCSSLVLLPLYLSDPIVPGMVVPTYLSDQSESNQEDR